jgi:hypothetical protein
VAEVGEYREACVDEVNMKIKRLMDLGCHGPASSSWSRFAVSVPRPTRTRRAAASRSASNRIRASTESDPWQNLLLVLVRKSKAVVDGIAHIHASFNNTIVVLLTVQAVLCLGLPPMVAQVSAVRVKHPFFAAQVARTCWVKLRWNSVLKEPRR